MRGKIRIAIVGIGNAAHSLLRALHTYASDERRGGLWHIVVGGYRVSDIEPVAAFDIDSRKVGLDVVQACQQHTSGTAGGSHLSNLGIKVSPGVLHDQLSSYLKPLIEPRQETEAAVTSTLESCRADVVLNLISSGLDASSKAYAKCALDSGASFINATPAPIAKDIGSVRQFKDAKLVVVGDDLMSQFGGTAFHRGILDLMHRRGVEIVESYQLDVGGTTETLNTLESKVKRVKQTIKTKVISGEIPYKFATVAGTSDHIRSLGENRTSYYWIRGRTALESPLTIDIYLRTNDGSNAINPLVDTIRAVRRAVDVGSYGAPDDICNYGFKSAPSPVKLHDAYEAFTSRYL